MRVAAVVVEGNKRTRTALIERVVGHEGGAGLRPRGGRHRPDRPAPARRLPRRDRPPGRRRRAPGVEDAWWSRWRSARGRASWGRWASRSPRGRAPGLEYDPAQPLRERHRVRRTGQGQLPARHLPARPDRHPPRRAARVAGGTRAPPAPRLRPALGGAPRRPGRTAQDPGRLPAPARRLHPRRRPDPAGAPLGHRSPASSRSTTSPAGRPTRSSTPPTPRRPARSSPGSHLALLGPAARLPATCATTPPARPRGIYAEVSADFSHSIGNADTVFRSDTHINLIKLQGTLVGVRAALGPGARPLRQAGQVFPLDSAVGDHRAQALLPGRRRPACVATARTR